MSDAVHDVLWTSGWDSTFRVADLVLTHGRVVRPHYLIDPSRLSTEVELETIAELRKAIAAKSDDAGSLLMPLAIHHGSDFRLDADTAASLRRLRTITHLGPQNDLLIPLAQSLAPRELEHCSDRGEGTHRFSAFLGTDAARDPAPPPDDVYRIVDRPSKPDLAVYGYFRFPVLRISKVEMGEEANLRGFGDIMEMTWFCRRPTRRRGPCGICGPCSDAREEGLGRRVPEVGRPLRLARSFDQKARRVARKARRTLIPRRAATPR